MNVRFLAASVFCVLLAAPGAPPAQAATPDMPFLGDVYELQFSVQQALTTAHARIASKGVLDTLDDDYDELSGHVNGFLERVASEVEDGNVHQDALNARADAIVTEARDFQQYIGRIGASRRQSARPVEATCAHGLKSCEIAFSFDPAAMIADRRKFVLDRAKLDDAERAAFASRVRAHFWPHRCAIGLEKPACPPASEKP